MPVPALFLDRDGVINVDHGYVHRIEDFEFIPGIFDLVRESICHGYRILVVTNQAGIGRGYYSEQQFHRLTSWMKNEFLLRNAPIDAVYFCPFHPIHGVGIFRQDSEDRKPKPGMFLRAAREWDIDLPRSVVVGDHATDIIAACAAGISQCFLFRSADQSNKAIPVKDFSDVVAHVRVNGAC
jgi:D-glycero-D-manno-heptose 1,7-bisphosphate phosphatase